MAEWKEAGMAGDSWKPEAEGDTIQGIYVMKKENVGVNASNVYVVRKGDEDLSVWGSTVLDTKFQEIPEGAEVKIEFVGMVKGKGPKPYKDFRVDYREVPMKEAGTDEDIQALKDVGLL